MARRTVMVVLAQLVCAGALAQSPVAVHLGELTGRNSPAARRVIRAGLEERGYRIVERGDAQVVVAGSAAARGQRWTIRLTISDASGNERGTLATRVSGARGVTRMIGRLASAIDEAASGDAPPASQVEVPPVTIGTDVPAESTQTEPTETPVAEGSSPEPPPPAPSPPPRRPPAAGNDAQTEAPLFGATVVVGAGVRSRGVEFLSPDGVDAAYRADVYFEIAARGEARLFDILFVRAWFGSSIALSSEREDPMLDQVRTHFYRLSGDVGARYLFDDTAGIGAAFGAGWDRYELSFNELVPTAEYVHLRPAIVSTFRFVGALFSLDAELGLRIPLGVGDLESLFGVEHDAIGVDGQARFYGVIEPGFTWAVEVGFRHYDLTFRRPGGDVTGVDRGWHATGFAGWTF